MGKNEIEKAGSGTMCNREQRNIEAIATYLKAGCKSRGNAFKMGLELEHFVLNASDEPVSYSGFHGIEELLQRLEPWYDKKISSQGHLIGLERQGTAISIEPAAQLEISITPQDNAEAVFQIYYDFYRECNEVLQEWGYHLAEIGYLPKGKAKERELIPKKRYEYMDHYFQTIGPSGCYMMRGTASTQVSIDYYSEEDCMRKYRTAYFLWPFLACMASNIPFFEDEQNTNPLRRSAIWQSVDPERTDVFAKVNEEKLSFYSYGEFIYHTPLIVAELDGEFKGVHQSAAALYQDKTMTETEIEHALSMVFPAIRIKHYLEIRYADSLPIEEAVGYMLMIKGLLSNPAVTLEWLERKGICRVNDVKCLLEKIYCSGLKTEIGGVQLQILLEELSDMAKERLSKAEQEKLQPFLRRFSRGNR